MEIRRVLHVAGRNVLLCIAALALIGLAGEAWLRWTTPFVQQYPPLVFVPGVGLLLRPDSEVRWTNDLDFWTVSRTNRLGFLDREPPSPERTAKGCHIAMIGDSFVEAKEVPIHDKFHVRLEEMAARELPALDVTTSAFGKADTGQISQLAFYDAYVRPLRPKLVVLVFVINDFVDNFPLWTSLGHGVDPEHLPYVSAARAEDGSFRLRPPDPEWRRHRLPRPSDSGPPATPRRQTLAERALMASRFLQWLHHISAQHTVVPLPGAFARGHGERIHRMELLRGRPAYARLLDEWLPGPGGDERIPPIHDVNPAFHALFTAGNDSPFYTEALAFTAFGLDEFRKRAERDGAALVILASHTLSHYYYRGGGQPLARLEEMAAQRSIPVIDQSGFIRRRGGELHDAHWKRDSHWSPTGHRWAAEALLEYLKRNQGSRAGCAEAAESYTLDDSTPEVTYRFSADEAHGNPPRPALGWQECALFNRRAGPDRACRGSVAPVDGPVRIRVPATGFRSRRGPAAAS